MCQGFVTEFSLLYHLASVTLSLKKKSFLEGQIPTRCGTHLLAIGHSRRPRRHPRSNKQGNRRRRPNPRRTRRRAVKGRARNCAGEEKSVGRGGGSGDFGGRRYPPRERTTLRNLPPPPLINYRVLKNAVGLDSLTATLTLINQFNYQEKHHLH